MSENTSFTDSDFYGTSGGDAPPVETTEVVEAGTEGAAPVTDGQGEATGETTKSYFDPSAHANDYVRVKVDGEEVEVPLSEALSGYMRQADYTRKTQEVATQRQQLEFWGRVDQAMQVDKKATLDYLAKTFGVEVAAEAANRADEEGGEQTEVDPYQQQLMALQEQFAPVVQHFQQQQLVAQLDRTIQSLQSKYADFDEDAVLAHADSLGIYDPNALEAVYKDLMFEKYRAAAEAAGLTKQQKAEQDAARAAAAQQAATAVSRGGSAAGAGKVTNPPAQPRTPAEAFAMAKAELIAQGQWPG